MAKTPRGPRTGPDVDGTAGSASVAELQQARRGARDETLTIVACGASAGGLEALTQLVSALPPDVKAAIVLIPHLAPEHPSMMAELLQRHTALPVTEITHGMPVERGHVYVSPPGVYVGVSDRRLVLSPRPEGLYHPIDHCFRTLAEQSGNGIIAVVLSGTGTDGTSGLRDVRAAGGIAMAQSPQTAKHDGMPLAAIATNAVDVVLPPAELAREIARLAQAPVPGFILHAAGEADTTAKGAGRDEHMQRIFTMLRTATGVDFRQYKLPTIERRLHRRILLHKLTKPEEYVRLLRENPEEVHALYADILIHVTRFFREPESFQALAQHVLPRIIKENNGDVPIRAWVAGCATGEEAYSLAITVLECLGDDAARTPLQIFATDVSEDAIQHARAGTYAAAISNDVSPERLRRFFTQVDGGYRVSKPVRDVCVFARQDVTRDPPFSRLDLILCRNVLIYLSVPLQRRLMNVFHYALRPGRYLVLGHAETVGTHYDLFELEDRRHRIYAKKGVELPAAGPFSVEAPPVRSLPARPVIPARDDQRAVQIEASRILLDRYAPAGVVVDDDLQIVHFRGATGTYLEPAAGEPSLHLFKMAREGLLHGLRSAFNEARLTGRGARHAGIRVRQNGGWQPVAVEVIPLNAADRRHFLVLFQPEGEPGEAAPAVALEAPADAPPDESDQRVHTLEDELAASRTYLQSIIQELEAANEELQSANEEILSSNEELQSTNEELDTAKEELQSTNEELNTVNDELHGRNEELSRANGDLMNILSSVQIAIVIVSSDLRIRRFTPMAERMLNLIATDVGRPIGHIKPNLDVPELEQSIREAIDTVTPVDRQVQDPQGNWFALRIRPYKSVDNRIEGAVLSLFDIEALHRQEVEMREMRQYAEAVVQAIGQPLVVLDGALRVRTANPAFLAALGLTEPLIRDRPFCDVADGHWHALRAALERLVEPGGTDGVVELSHAWPGDGGRHMEIDARRIEGPAGRPPLVLLSFTEHATLGTGDG